MYNAISGFRPKYYEDGRAVSSMIQRILIGNSKTLVVGSRVKMVGADGVHPADAVGDKTYGYVVGFEARNGLPLSIASDDSNLVSGTFTEANTGDTYAASASNMTADKVVALVVPAEGLVVSAKLDAAAGTTTGSNLPHYYIDIETTAGNYATLLDESSATSSIANFATVPAQGNEASCLDPEANASGDRRVLVKAAELQSVGDAVAQSA